MLRHIALALIATACFAAETAPVAAAASAAACSAIAADQVPAPAKAALVKAGADVAKLGTCTKDGVVRYCANVTGADGKTTMIEVDAAGVALAAVAAAEGCGGCCPTAPK